MAAIALKMLWDSKLRLIITVLGIAVLFFLSAAQVGLLVGWCYTVSALIRHTRADLWVMAKGNPTFDFGTAIADQRIYQVRSVPGIAWAEGMFASWTFWQRPDGGRVNVAIVGLDESCEGGPWRILEGNVEAVHLPETVMVDELYLDLLGVARIGDEVEILGQRAVVRGITQEVRSFTASPFIFTSIKSGRKYQKQYADDEVTYVIARCHPGYSSDRVRDAVLNRISGVDCLTSQQFAVLTMKYWMLKTGAGITVVVTAILGFVVSAAVISQTLYAMTQDHLSDYAALLALGFSRWQLSGMVFVQSLLLGASGILLGTGLYVGAAHVSARTPLPLETTPAIYTALVVTSLASCVLASFLAVRVIFRVDPVEVFRA